MKDQILFIIREAFAIYFYILIARLVLDFVKEEIRRHPLAGWVYLLTNPVLHFIKKYVPSRDIGGINVDVALVLLILLYRIIVDVLLGILNFILF